MACHRALSLALTSLSLLPVTQKTTYKSAADTELGSIAPTTDDRMEIRNDLNRKEHRAKTNMMEREERNAKFCI